MLPANDSCGENARGSPLPFSAAARPCLQGPCITRREAQPKLKPKTSIEANTTAQDAVLMLYAIKTAYCALPKIPFPRLRALLEH